MPKRHALMPFFFQKIVQWFVGNNLILKEYTFSRQGSEFLYRILEWSIKLIVNRFSLEVHYPLSGTPYC